MSTAIPKAVRQEPAPDKVAFPFSTSTSIESSSAKNIAIENGHDILTNDLLYVLFQHTMDYFCDLPNREWFHHVLADAQGF